MTIHITRSGTLLALLLLAATNAAAGASSTSESWTTEIGTLSALSESMSIDQSEPEEPAPDGDEDDVDW